MYRNQEGYADPTAGNAIENVLKEQKKINSWGKIRKSCQDPRYT